MKKASYLSLLVLAFLLVAIASRPAATTTILVRASSTNEAAHIVQQHGCYVTQHLAIINAVTARVAPAQLAAISADSRAQQVYQDKSVEVAGNGAPSVFYPEVVGADQAWSQSVDGEGVVVAVVDTGLDFPGS